MDISATLKFVQEYAAEQKESGGLHSNISHAERFISILQNGEKNAEAIRSKVNTTLSTSFKQLQAKIDAAEGEEKERLEKLAGIEKLPKAVPFEFPQQDFSPKND